MMGIIYIVGIGPGNPDLVTEEAKRAIGDATDLVGYDPYLNRVTINPQACRHGSDNRYEISRGELAIKLAQQGKNVAVISGGDPGVFGMASAVFEVVQQQPEEVREALDIRVIPGISAVLACSARLGAPLGGDFCVMSLSDNLKPWEVILKRLRYAASAGFVIAVYNPRSKARPMQLEQAFATLRGCLEARTPVAFAKAATREGEALHVTTLQEADAQMADMRTLIIIGNENSHFIGRGPGKRDWFYTSRKVEKKL